MVDFEEIRNPDTDLVFSLRAKWYKPDSFEDDLGNKFTPKNCKGIVENAGRHQYWDFQSGFFSLNSQSKIGLIGLPLNQRVERLVFGSTTRFLVCRERKKR